MPEKCCARCGEIKPFGEFYKDKREKDGLYSCCKSCHLARTKNWRVQNPEKQREGARKWREVNRERAIEKLWQWRNANAERAREHARDYAERHEEKHRARKAVRVALKQGKLSRPEICEDCGSRGHEYRDGRAAIQAHHDDYAEPLEVRWLCGSCHGAQHRVSVAV